MLMIRFGGGIHHAAADMAGLDRDQCAGEHALGKQQFVAVVTLAMLEPLPCGVDVPVDGSNARTEWPVALIEHTFSDILAIMPEPKAIACFILLRRPRSDEYLPPLPRQGSAN